jgi:hypothetical protein
MNRLRRKKTLLSKRSSAGRLFKQMMHHHICSNLIFKHAAKMNEKEKS